jgi:hypothetical protein
VPDTIEAGPESAHRAADYRMAQSRRNFRQRTEHKTVFFDIPVRQL